MSTEKNPKHYYFFAVGPQVGIVVHGTDSASAQFLACCGLKQHRINKYKQNNFIPPAFFFSDYLFFIKIYSISLTYNLIYLTI